MPDNTVVSVRLPDDYIDQIDVICNATGKKRSQVVVDAVANYLGKVDGAEVLSDLERVNKRLDSLEKKLQQSIKLTKTG